MKTLTVAAIVLAGMIGIGIGTAAHAGERNATAKIPTIELNGLTYRVGIDIEGSWEPQGAVETGAIPGTGDSAVRDGGSRTADGVPTYEVSGRTYRAGIDDGP